MITTPLDEVILETMKGARMTYHIRNRIAMSMPEFRDLKTSAVRYRLTLMEKAGIVRRGESIYAREIAWERVTPPQTKGRERG